MPHTMIDNSHTSIDGLRDLLYRVLDENKTMGNQISALGEKIDGFARTQGDMTLLEVHRRVERIDEAQRKLIEDVGNLSRLTPLDARERQDAAVATGAVLGAPSEITARRELAAQQRGNIEAIKSFLSSRLFLALLAAAGIGKVAYDGVTEPAPPPPQVYEVAPDEMRFPIRK